MTIRRVLWAAALAAVAMLSACGGAGSSADVGPDEVPEAVSDVPADLPTDLPIDLPAEASTDAAHADAPADPGQDGDADVPPELPPLPTQAPLATPADPLAGTDVASCAVYQAETCDAGTRRRCEVYDPTAHAFVDAPDPLLERALLFDRWRDLHQTPDGQAIDRDFTGPTLPGTPESEWGALDHLSGYWGTVDGGIWTGWSVVAAVLRYSQTGTQADYDRMEQHVRDLVAMFEATGIPGYFIRYHFLLMPDDAPQPADHIIRRVSSAGLTHEDRDVDPAALKFLPAAYTDGYAGPDGTLWKGRPMWHGNPSIDQVTGPMTSLPMAFDLLRDPELKARIATHLTCYLKRLQRIEVIHLQQNPQLLAALVSYFQAGELKLDPDDIDLKTLDRVVGYVARQINPLNEATFDTSCPDGVQMEPWRVVDAAKPSFMGEMLKLVNDMKDSSGAKEQIDHYYFPNLRGADAMHLMHLATMAYHMTGNEQYRRFLYTELIGNLHTDQVALTTGAFDLPKWCKAFFGNQITYGPWWAFLHLIGDCPLKTTLQRGFAEELWDKMVKPDKNLDFEIMYAGALPASAAKDHDAALAEAMALLPRMGGNGYQDGVLLLNDPRRAYPLDRQFVADHAPDGAVATCPTQPEIDACTATIAFMGIQLPGPGMDEFACTEVDPWACSIGNGQCVWKQMSSALPPDLRPWSDFLWQRNPYALGANPGVTGGSQYAGSDVSEPYWNARRYGFVTQGAGQVLAWRSLGACAE